MELKHFETPEQVAAELKKCGFAIGTVRPADYHDWKDKLGTPCVSKSSLLDFVDNAFAHKYKVDNNIKKDSPALRMGSLIDCLALTPDLFTELYVVNDDSRNSKAYKALAAELEPRGITIIKSDEYAVGAMAAKAAVEVISEMCGTPGRVTCDGKGYATQVGMWVWLDSIGAATLETPLIVSGMLDVMPLGEGMPLVDLKSTSTDVSDDRKLNGNISDYGYGVQAAMYVDMFQVCMGEEWARGFQFVFVGSAAPCQTRVVRMLDSDMEFYRAKYSLALQEYAHCCATGKWGEQHLPEMTYSMPVWEARKGVEA